MLSYVKVMHGCACPQAMCANAAAGRPTLPQGGYGGGAHAHLLLFGLSGRVYRRINGLFVYRAQKMFFERPNAPMHRWKAVSTPPPSSPLPECVFYLSPEFMCSCWPQCSVQPKPQDAEAKCSSFKAGSSDCGSSLD